MKGSSHQHHDYCTTTNTQGVCCSQHGESTVVHKHQLQCQLRAQVWVYTPAVNIQWTCRRRPSYSSKRDPHGLCWHETT